jgi:nucleotide-binding universal stress UspA family protein
MEISSGPIVIPWDFTQVAEDALQYAAPMSKQFNNENFALIHIAKNKNDREKKQKLLEEIARERAKTYNINIKPFVRVGKPISGIGDFAREHEAKMVIMGTHGIKGTQKITGSRALKAVVHAQVPFIVLRKLPVKKKIQRVVFPVQYKTETKEKLNLVHYLHKLFQPKFYMFQPNYSDESFQKKAKTNLGFCRKYLDKWSTDYEMEYNEGRGGFVEELLKYAKSVEADLILIISTKHISFIDYWTGAYEQHIMANEEGIPVMIQNPVRGLGKFESFH